MERRHGLMGLLACFGLLVLIFDSKLALEGARAGLELCLCTVVPSLFPFFVLSMMMQTAFSGTDSWILRAAAKCVGISKAAAPVLVPAFLGGYPVGAKCIGDMYREKRIGRSEACRLLGFCSNAGPSFLFGMVSGFFPKKSMVWMLWVIHIFSALFTAWSVPVSAVPEEITGKKTPASKRTDVILSAAKAMALVCCWVILFRLVITFLQSWCLWLIPAWGQVLLMGALELANGCCELMLVTEPEQRFVLCSCMLAFGGICVLMQTISVTEGLPVGGYLRGKLIQTAFSFLLSSALVRKDGGYFLLLVPLLLVFLRKTQIRYGNVRAFPV